MRQLRTSYGYDTYRGRTRTQKVLTAIIVILVIVLLLAVAAFFVIQRYMVYTDDGRAHLELPFFQKEQPVEPSQGPDIVVTTPDPTLPPTPTPVPVMQTDAVWLLRASLLDGTAQAQVEADGGNAALFNMKADDGSLGYVSDLPQAVAMRTFTADPGLNDAIRALTGSELYTIARVSCFKDDLAPQKNNALAIKTNSGYNWRDGENVRWMNPSVAEAREYVVGVCKELAELGFDEILLENACWPTQGHLEYIKVGEAYDPDHLSETVEQFYQEVVQALEGTGVKLSISTQRTALEEDGDMSGQTPELLSTWAERLYLPLPEAGEKDDILVEKAGFEAEQVVYLISDTAERTREGSTLLVRKK